MRNKYFNVVRFHNLSDIVLHLRFSILIFIFHFSLLSSSFSQVVYEPIHKDIYNYLSRLNLKGIIEFENLIKPLSREYIATRLIELDSKKTKITNLENKELKFYFSEYGNEIEKVKSKKGKVEDNKTSKNIVKNGFEFIELKNSSTPTRYDYSLFSKDKYGRFRVFGYSDKNVNLIVNPILGFEFTSWDSKNSNHIWNGVSFYGSYGDNIGFSMDFRDNSQSGVLQDPMRNFVPEQGVRRNGGKSFEFNIVNAMVSYKWNWGSISIGKTPFEFGYAENGKIVHSSKAPSYPNIRLDLKITDWLSLNYMHGWLNSEVIDSNEIYETLSTKPDWNRELFREKYFATHSLNIKPIKGISVVLGESIIYSDRLELSYLVPVMFFRLADHYHSSHNNDAGNNAQFFFNLSSRNHIPNTHLFATLFIDEIITGEILNANKAKNQIGYSLGLSVVDFPIKNGTLKLEYSHINPFAYEHYIQTQTYQNQGYDLGHWIGHNADLLHISYSQRYLRGLSSKIWAQFIRKGDEGNADLMYQIPQPEFLFGLNTNYTYYGIDLNYEFIHDLHLRAKYQHSTIEAESVKGQFEVKSFDNFKLALFYGL